MQSVNPLDEAAFTELYVQHVDAVYRICYSFLKNRTDAEDAVQETFLRLMQSQKPLENDAHLRGWLVVTASNVCKNMLAQLAVAKTTRSRRLGRSVKIRQSNAGRNCSFESPHAAAGKI